MYDDRDARLEVRSDALGAYPVYRANAGGGTWFSNSARGALALSVAVAVADLTNVQHAFWVVLAALSVLRTNALSTGSSALGALNV